MPACGAVDGKPRATLGAGTLSWFYSEKEIIEARSSHALFACNQRRVLMLQRFDHGAARASEIALQIKRFPTVFCVDTRGARG